MVLLKLRNCQSGDKTKYMPLDRFVSQTKSADNLFFTKHYYFLYEKIHELATESTS